MDRNVRQDCVNPERTIWTLKNKTKWCSYFVLSRTQWFCVTYLQEIISSELQQKLIFCKWYGCALPLQTSAEPCFFMEDQCENYIVAKRGFLRCQVLYWDVPLQWAAFVWGQACLRMVGSSLDGVRRFLFTKVLSNLTVPAPITYMYVFGALS